MLHNLRISSRLLLMVLAAVIGMAVISGIGLSKLEQNLTHDRKIKTRHLVEVVHSLLGYYANQQALGILTESNAKKQAMNAIRQIRYGAQDYFWINDLDHQMLMHPFRSELEGEDISQITDPTGKKLFQVFVKVAKTQGAGFVDYYWPKPNKNTPVPKISFVMLFKPWDWVIGSGIYTDDISQLFREEAVLTGWLVGVILLATFLFSIFIGRSISLPLEFISKRLGELIQSDSTGSTSTNQDTSELEALEQAVNVIQENAKERELAEEKIRKLSLAVEQSPVSVIITDLEGQIEYVNNQFIESSGYNFDEALGQNTRMLKSGRTHSSVYRKLWKTLAEGGTWKGEFHNRRKDGSFFWEQASITPIKDTSGVTTHYLAIEEDISLRKSYEEKLLHQANFDQLTNLPNRILATDRLEQTLRQCRRAGKRSAVLYLDLDHFKKINDTHSHKLGDQILKIVAARLSSCIRDSDTVARMGGDGFLIILHTIESNRDPERVSVLIQEKIQEPIVTANQEFFISASIGISIFPADGHDTQIMLRNADAALYTAKEEGRANFRFFTPELNARAQENLTLETELHRALDRQEFIIHYQPLVDVTSRKTLSVEALLRWKNKKLGQIGPDKFIPAAEQSGLISKIGIWVLEEACAKIRQWSDESGRPIRLAVNISPRQFQDGSLVDTVKDAIKSSGIQPHQLELELTERLLMDRKSEITQQIKDLKKLGVCLSIDDFGTGYSSLSYLRSYPFDVLKIDRSFIMGVTENAEDAALCRAITAMAHSLNLEVVAEGVETPEQFKFMQEIGCDIIQGYYFSKPMPDNEAQSYLVNNTSVIRPA